MDLLKYLNERLNENSKILTDEIIAKFLSVFNTNQYNKEDYIVLKQLVKEGYASIPTVFKSNQKVLEDFIEENLDISSFNENIWTEELTLKYIKTILVRYRSSKHFSIPKTLYSSRRLFHYLLDTGLIVIDRNYYYKGKLNDEDIEKYIQFLKKINIHYIPNKSNFINNSDFLNRILKENLIDYIDSFKKEAWTDENITLYISKNCTNIPNPLYESEIVLKHILENKNAKEINNFQNKAWTDDNIELLINNNLLDEIEVPSYLLSDSRVLRYLLINNLNSVNRFNYEAWTEDNITIFKEILLKESIPKRQFPVNFRFDSNILEFCLKNKIVKYINVFLKQAFTNENIELLKMLMNENIIDNIPSPITDNNKLLKYCLQNKLTNYLEDFKGEAWDMKDAINYIGMFEKDEDIIFTNGIKHSKLFLHTIMFMDKTDLLVNFSNSCWNEDYIELLFEIIAMHKDNIELKNELKKCYYSLKNENVKASFRNYIIINRDDFGNLDQIKEVLEAVENSNSSELRHIAGEVTYYVLTKENPLKEFKKIEKIFLSNELPSIAKVYNIFRTFHSNEDGSLWINPSSNISPVLKHYSNDQRGSRFCEAIIFSDLLKAVAGSNNRSLINYLKKLKESDTLLNKIASGEIQISDLKIEDITNIESYLKNLTALYNQTLKGKNNPYIMTDNLPKDILNLLELYKIDGIDNLLDRVVRMYANFLGIKTYDEMIKYIEDKVKKADEKGRNNREFYIKKGDFIKGINDIAFLSNILNNGILASEFLGSNAKKTGDLTPFDTDGSLAQKDGTIEEIFSNRDLAAFYYGNTWIVFKTEGKVQITRDNEKEIDNTYDSEKIELFHSGANGIDHYGIRTGFPSTDIDYIITESYKDIIGFEIARNGFYIPVLDTKGNLLFTEKMYDETRRQMDGLSYYGIDNYTFSDNLILPDIEKTIENMNEEDETYDIRRIIDETLSKYNLIQNDKLDGNLSRNIYNFIDIGSTGRKTNIEDNSDYDFMLMLDQNIMNDKEKLEKVKQDIRKALGKETLTHEDHIYNGNFRFKNVKIGNKKIDIDISFEGKTDKITYSSDMAIKDKLKTMESISKEKTILSKANIIIAKKLLKKNGIYKPINSEEREGGLGGIGVENWILSNNGSFIDASISFIDAYRKAYDNSESKTDTDILKEFNKIYKIWNFGENYFSIKNNKPLHNEFINDNLSAEGLKKMTQVLKKYLKSIDIDYERRKVL